VSISSSEPTITESLSGLDFQDNVEGDFDESQGDPSLFKKSNQLRQKGKTYQLPGDIGKFLGRLSETDNSITLTGDMGSGKTRFAFQLINAYASIGLSVGVFCLEMSPDNYKVIEMKNQYILPANQSMVQFAGELPNGIEDIEKAAQSFDVIVIDSWTKTNLPQTEFDRLIKAHRNTAWVVLFQKTSGGKIRGGPAANYDAWVNLDTIKGSHYKENYVVATKNRYGDVGIKFNVYEQKIVQ
jgi:predicted ATP-dependent serine protease